LQFLVLHHQSQDLGVEFRLFLHLAQLGGVLKLLRGVIGGESSQPDERETQANGQDAEGLDGFRAHFLRHIRRSEWKSKTHHSCENVFF
jgi:hypothetical protein